MPLTAQITTAIDKQKQELIKEQIAAILAVEITAQEDITTATETLAMLQSFFTPSGDPKIYLDREDDLQEDELNGIIIRNASEEYQDGSYVKKKVTATYEIVILAADASTSSTNGDILSRRTSQRIAKICHKILNSGYYLTLGFATGYIGNRNVKSLTTYTPKEYATIGDAVLTPIATMFELDVYYDDVAITAAPVALDRITTKVYPDTGAFQIINEDT